ncbi:MAG: LysE family transporter [Verrucomicrobiota bacterium]|jgi:threonine/homoserine/homoserine lactone efflux protein
MFDLPPSLLAALTGFLSGFVLSVPVGPVNLTIINEGARRGLLWALLIGFGATAMEVIYCALAFTGFASFFDGRVVKAAMELTSFVFMLYLGLRFLNTRTIESVAPVEEKIKERLQPHSAFATGFVRVMGNPGVFLFWIVLAAYFKSRDWVGASVGDVASCVAGVALGTNVWFSGLSYAVSRGHKKFTERTLLHMEHGSGVCLLGLAVAQGAHIVWQMVKHKM